MDIGNYSTFLKSITPDSMPQVNIQVLIDLMKKEKMPLYLIEQMEKHKKVKQLEWAFL